MGGDDGIRRCGGHEARFGGEGLQPLGFQFQGKSSPMRLIG
jgi:hypothetical protein